jgi:heparan sulfate N-deacetylase/N-sulfotransferase NDST2
MKAHEDPAAMQHSFYEVLRANKSQTDLYHLKQKCLDPGKYFQHLKKWLKVFSPLDFYIIDGDLFRLSPHVCLNDLQSFLQVNATYRLEYKNVLRFNKKKNFSCYLLKNGQEKCLGASKGRKYEKMDSQSMAFLSSYYSDWNKNLYRLLKFYDFTIPIWLKKQLKVF